MLTEITLMGGGPGDGETFGIESMESQTKLQEKEYCGCFVWCYLYSIDGRPHIYFEQHPRDEMDYLPPNKLELWYDEKYQIKIEDLA